MKTGRKIKSSRKNKVTAPVSKLNKHSLKNQFFAALEDQNM